jgi:hypothetical protein
MKLLIAPLILVLVTWSSAGVALAESNPVPCTVAAGVTADYVVNYLDRNQVTDHVQWVYAVDASSDPDQLLGLPGQYISKAGLVDDRSSYGDVYVEVFQTRADRAARLVALQGSAARVAPETYIALDRILLRLPNVLTPQAIEAYRTELNGLCAPY